MADMRTAHAERITPHPVVLFGVWTALAVLTYVRRYLQQPPPNQVDFWPQLFLWLACFYPLGLLTPVIFHLEHRFAITRESWRRNVPILAAASLPVSYAAFLLTLALTFAVARVEERGFWAPNPFWAIPAGEFWFEEFFFWSILSAGYVLRNLRALHQHQRESARLALEKARLESSLRKAELEALRMRLNPHFLFNSLQNISALAQQDSRTAARMLSRLGDLLRAAFHRDFQPEVPLQAELALARAYLEMEQMRFGDRLTVSLDIAPEAEHASVPSLLLQPLLENAIVHGLNGKTTGGRISIAAETRDTRLVILVRDNGTGPPGELEMGLGLGSTRERLARMYPEEHVFTVQALESGGTEVRIEVPLRGNHACAASADR